MQPSQELPKLGDDFADLCERSLEDCVRRILTVASQRAEAYNSLTEKHDDLVGFIQSLDTE